MLIYASLVLRVPPLTLYRRQRITLNSLVDGAHTSRVRRVHDKTAKGLP